MQIVIKIPKLFPKSKVLKMNNRYYPLIKRHGEWRGKDDYDGRWWSLTALCDSYLTLEEAIERTYVLHTLLEEETPREVWKE